MINPVQQFGSIAKRLAYNPLGIIALFIVLCYAIGCLLFSTSIEYLLPCERWPLIWFVVTFPVIVLLVFAWLVAKHHTKLYAPNDFPDASTYLRTLGIDEQKKKIDDEVAEAVAEAPKQSETAKTPNEHSLRKKLVIAEDLAIRELQTEFGVSINRQIGIGADQGFDGMFVKEGSAYIVEVKLAMSGRVPGRLWNVIDRIKGSASQYNWRRTRCILAVVAANSDQKKSIEEAYAAELKQGFSDFVILRVYTYEDLSRKYGIE